MTWMSDRRSLRTGHIVIKNDGRDDRDRIVGEHQSLTAQIMGDPRPGRSALDRKMDSANVGG